MASKYAALFDKFPAEPPEDAKKQEKIELLKPQFAGLSATDLAQELAHQRNAEAELATQFALLTLRREALEQLLTATYENEAPEWGAYGASESTLRLADGSKFEIRREPKASVIDKDANRLWAIANGMERLLALPWRTLDSTTKERLVNGDPEPDGVAVFIHTSVRFTSAKKEKE
jgi:hypothetical protein